MADDRLAFEIAAELRGALAPEFAKLETQLKQSVANQSKVLEGLGQAWNKIRTAIGAVLGALGTRALFREIVDVANEVDRLAKSADSLGTTAQDVAALEFAFESLGVQSSKVEAILRSLERQRSAALRAPGGQRDAFELLGITFQQLTELNAPDLLAKMADGMQRLTSRTEQNVALSAIFTDNFLEVRRLLDSGTRFEDLFGKGQAINAGLNDQVERVGEFRDSLLELDATFQSVKRGFLIEIIPVLTDALSGLTDLLKLSKDLLDFLKPLAAARRGGFGITADDVRRQREAEQAEREQARQIQLRELNFGTAPGLPSDLIPTELKNEFGDLFDPLVDDLNQLIPLLETFSAIQSRVRQSFESDLSGALQKAALEAGNLGDVLTAFVDSFRRSILKLLSDIAAEGISDIIFGAVKGGFFGAGAGGGAGDFIGPPGPPGGFGGPSAQGGGFSGNGIRIGTVNITTFGPEQFRDALLRSADTHFELTVAAIEQDQQVRALLGRG